MYMCKMVWYDSWCASFVTNKEQAEFFTEHDMVAAGL